MELFDNLVLRLRSASNGDERRNLKGSVWGRNPNDRGLVDISMSAEHVLDVDGRNPHARRFEHVVRPALEEVEALVVPSIDVARPHVSIDDSFRRLLVVV